MARRMSLQARLLPAVARLARLDRNYRTREDLRRHIADLRRRPQPAAPPIRTRAGVAITTTTTAAGWPLHRVEPTGGRSRGTVVYLHGGAWIHQAVPLHWRWTQRLADQAAVTVLMPVYPLVHQGGTAARVVPRVADLVDQLDGPVVLMGDSAGGTIAISAALLLNRRRRPPTQTVLISAAFDLRMINPEIDRVQPTDPWLVKRGLLEVVDLWAGDRLDDPVLNPINGELHGLSPLMIFAGTRDILAPDTRLFVRRAVQAGVEVDYTELAGQLHVYPLMPIPEGRQAQQKMIMAVSQAFAEQD